MICLLIQGHFLVADGTVDEETPTSACTCLSMKNCEVLPSNMSRKKQHLHLNLLFHMQPREMIDMGVTDFMASLSCWQKSLLLLLCCLTPELEPSSNLKIIVGLCTSKQDP